MILKVLIYLTFMGTADFYCLRRIPQIRKCHKGRDNPSFRKVQTTLTDCLDMCLSNNRMHCGIMQWKDTTKECSIAKVRFNQRGGPGCIHFGKSQSCQIKQDVACLRHSDTGLVDQHGQGFRQVATQEECQSICLLSEFCTSYVYNSERRHCTHQSKFGSHNYRKPIAGEILMEKIKNCQAGRCANIEPNPGRVSSRYRFEHTSAENLYQCLKTMIKRKDKYAMHWDLRTRSCRLYKVRLKNLLRPQPMQHTIEVTESPECNDNPPTEEVCTRKQSNYRMRGGLELVLTENDCVDFCKLIVACAAVDWNAGDCIFHFANTALILQTDWTHYQVIPCPAKSEYRIIRGGIVFIHYTRTTKRDERQEKDVVYTCIQCAVTCTVENCKGFECDEISGCVTQNALHAMYVTRG